VVKALLYLQEKYNFQDRYILVGHSCGATLAFQAVMKEDVSGTDAKLWEGLKLPKAIIGLEGIYDIPALLDTHQEIPVYKEFIETAFGTNEETWEFVSPTAGIYQNTWTNGVLAIVGHSDEDELVEKNQAELMRVALQDWGGRETSNGKKRLLLVDHGLKGKHDEIWQKGEEVSSCIHKALNILVGQSKLAEGPIEGMTPTEARQSEEESG
jgi:kynurenine formamidase